MLISDSLSDVIKLQSSSAVDSEPSLFLSTYLSEVAFLAARLEVDVFLRDKINTVCC